MRMTSSGSHPLLSGRLPHPTTPSPTMSMGGVTNVAHGATNILPDWLAVLWTLVFLAIVVIHVRHVLETHGERQIWHSGHVLMAVGMLFMFAPPSLDHFDIPATFWQLVFANAAGAVVLWVVAQFLSGAAVNRLWIVMAVDLGAMVYMWAPGGFVAPITWVLVAYFAAQALLWVSNRYRELDEHPIIGSSLSVNADGTLVAAAVAPLICERDLRPSMFVMTLGMAYMFAAMQLVM